MERAVDIQRFAVLWLILVFLLCLTAFSARADIYGYQDEEGYWHFPSDYLSNPVPKGIDRQKERKTIQIQAYLPLIRRIAVRYGVEEALIRAVIMAESEWDRTAISKKGAIGLMQLMPETAQEMMVKNPFSPRQNIEGGVRYLRELLTRFNNDIILAVAAYNAGPLRVEACGGVPPIAETRRFVRRVLFYYNQFKYAENIR